jgi:hypothetical protein
MVDRVRPTPRGGKMEIAVGAIAIVFVLWWLAEEFQRLTDRKTREVNEA